MIDTLSDGITVRHDFRPGDIGRVTWLHGDLYAREWGFDNSFEAYVAEGLVEFARQYDPARDRLWLAETAAGDPVGSVAILSRPNGQAQLRWLIVAPAARGTGLGRHLVASTLAFCRAASHHTLYLWTVSPLVAAARLYTSSGFQLKEELPTARQWGVELREQRYERTDLTPYPLS